MISASARNRLITGRARFGLLAQVADLGDGAVTLEETMRRLSEAIVPAFADVCAIEAVSDGELRRVAARAHGRGREDLESVLARRARTGPRRPRGLTRSSMEAVPNCSRTPRMRPSRSSPATTATGTSCAPGRPARRSSSRCAPAGGRSAP